MLFIIIIFLYLISIISCIKNRGEILISENSGLYKEYDKSSILHSRKYEYQVHNVGVFILGSFKGAVKFGEKEIDDQIDYYNRAEAAVLTWGSHAKVFYMVTGSGDSEKRILNNISYCNDYSTYYHGLLNRNYFEIYRCGIVNVLHLPHCDGSNWGPDGPCCRNNGAMLFFNDMHKVTVQHHKSKSGSKEKDYDRDIYNRNNGNDYVNNWNNHNKDIKKASLPLFPDWFIFCDDDYYIRLHMIESILSNPLTPAYKPYALYPMHWEGYESGQPNNLIPRFGYGLEIYNRNCTSPCIHQFPWLSFAGFSIGAIRQMEPSLRSNDSSLISVCKLWDITHDVGLGIYTWIHGFNGILIPDLKSDKSAIWHKVDMPYNKKFENLWSIISNSKNFNISLYVDYEKKEGLIAMHKYPLYKVNGKYNTIKYRRGQVRNELINQIQLNNNLVIKDIYNMASYSYMDCKEDYDIFNNWKDNDGNKIYNEWKNTNHEYNKILMCFEYSKYISNIKVDDKYLNVPNINNLI